MNWYRILLLLVLTSGTIISVHKYVPTITNSRSYLAYEEILGKTRKIQEHYHAQLARYDSMIPSRASCEARLALEVAFYSEMGAHLRAMSELGTASLSEVWFLLFNEYQLFKRVQEETYAAWLVASIYRIELNYRRRMLPVMIDWCISPDPPI